MLPLVLIHPCTAFTLTYSTLVKWFLSFRFLFCSHSLGFLHSLNHIRMYLHQLTRSRNKHYFIVYVCIFVCLHACMHACACVFGHFLFLILLYISCKLLNIFLNKKYARKMVFLIVRPEKRERESERYRKREREKKNSDKKKVQEKITEESGRWK